MILSAYIRKEERSKISNLSFHLDIEKLKTAIISKGFLEAWADIEDEELKGELDKIESELKMLIEQNPEDVKTVT